MSVAEDYIAQLTMLQDEELKAALQRVVSATSGSWFSFALLHHFCCRSWDFPTRLEVIPTGLDALLDHLRSPRGCVYQVAVFTCDNLRMDRT